VRGNFKITFEIEAFVIKIDKKTTSIEIDTLLVTNISHPKVLLKMIFLFQRWDMLVPWRV